MHALRLLRQPLQPVLLPFIPSLGGDPHTARPVSPCLSLRRQLSRRRRRLLLPSPTATGGSPGGGGGGYQPGGGGGGGVYPTPPLPNPFLPYFPFYYYSPPPHYVDKGMHISTKLIETLRQRNQSQPL